jgi:two-component system phosphate regulon sensor histidine kinase PhoR
MIRHLVRNFLQKASNNVDRLSSLVKDLDLITRIESDQLPLSIKKFDIVQLVRTVMELLEEKASQRNIQLLLGKNTPEAVYVDADFLKIEQVLVNLITNAIHYGRENGRVTADFFDLDDDVLIEITDDGLGIGQEHLPRIFERFYRVDKSRSRHEGGSGLGPCNMQTHCRKPWSDH